MENSYYKNLGFCLSLCKCKECMFVNKDILERKYNCSNCGMSNSKEHYLPVGAINMVAIIDTLFDKLPPSEEIIGRAIERKQSASDLAIIILFCSFTEVLLDNFLGECMNKMKIPEVVQDKIFNDNIGMKKKIDSLFKVITETTWKDALCRMKEEYEHDYSEVDKFCKRIIEARNKIIHKGDIIEIKDDDPERCCNTIKAITTLFIELHNEYISTGSGE